MCMATDVFKEGRGFFLPAGDVGNKGGGGNGAGILIRPSPQGGGGDGGSRRAAPGYESPGSFTSHWPL